MNEDRELLELAALAAGKSGFWVDAGLNTRSNAWPEIWNPLADDGDALRLAVALKMEVLVIDKWCFASGDFGPNSEPFGDDPFAATRRAIVRAAAEIERRME